MALVDRLGDIVGPVLRDLGLDLVDLEYAGGIVRVTVDEPGGIGSERLGQATVAVSKILDAEDPLPGRYTLEVSSPGVERALRIPRHFERAIGLKVSLRARTDDGFQRFVGVVTGSDDEGVTLSVEPEAHGEIATEVRVTYASIDRARTIFEWGPAPKPGKGSKPGGAKKRGTANAHATPHAAARTAATVAAGSTAEPIPGTTPGTPGTAPGGNR